MLAVPMIRGIGAHSAMDDQLNPLAALQPCVYRIRIFEFRAVVSHKNKDAAPGAHFDMNIENIGLIRLLQLIRADWDNRRIFYRNEHTGDKNAREPLRPLPFDELNEFASMIICKILTPADLTKKSTS